MSEPLTAYTCANPHDKAAQLIVMPPSAAAAARAFANDASRSLPAQPGRPTQPELVHPTQLARRKLGSVEGRVALVHAVAHIEFNAMNLALDAALRFADMPESFYADWLSVAVDEARHFLMLSERLEELGSAYGALPAHNGLWEMAEKTAHSVLERMALVPRVLEARGLDVTPDMIRKLRAVGDTETIAKLEVILHEEERHVAIGSRWFADCCAQRDVEPEATFFMLLKKYGLDRGRGPLNLAARERAGFSATELSLLAAG